MKVLLVTMYFPPAGGGGVQRPLKIATHLPSFGIETHVLAPDDPKWVHRDEDAVPPTQAWVHRARYHGPRGRIPSEELYALRHSAAHVMAGAVLDLFPDAKFGFGPPVADGFYYDFELPRPLTDEDLPKIEERMRATVGRNLPFEHREMNVPEAVKFFGDRHQTYKVEQIEKLGGKDREDDAAATDGKISIYQHGDFVDLCRGPHVERTGKIGPFRLLSIAGAYWRGKEGNPQLTRIYGTVWPNQKQLDAYLEKLKEIERRDHRTLGKELELFRIDEELGSGLVLWLPNLSIVREESIARAATPWSTRRTSRTKRSTSARGTSRSTARTCTGPSFWTRACSAFGSSR